VAARFTHLFKFLFECHFISVLKIELLNSGILIFACASFFVMVSEPKKRIPFSIQDKMDIASPKCMQIREHKLHWLPN